MAKKEKTTTEADLQEKKHSVSCQVSEKVFNGLWDASYREKCTRSEILRRALIDYLGRQMKIFEEGEKVAAQILQVTEEDLLRKE